MLSAHRHHTPHPAPSLSRRDAIRFFGLTAASLAIAPSLLKAGEDKKTPVLPSAHPAFYRFKIGAFDAIAFADGGFGGPTTQVQFWPSHSPEEVGEGLKEAFLPPDQIRVSFNVLLVKIGSELILIDSGAGPLFGPAGGKLAGLLGAAGISTDQITAVVLSHAHGDHMGGLLNAQSGAPVFKNARHFIHRREFEFWTGSSPDLSGVGVPDSEKQGMIAGAKKFLTALKFDKIQGGEKLLGGLEIIDAPGHTPGHINVLISSGTDQLLHIVDTAHHHALSFAHPDWNLVFDADPATANATRKKLLDRAAADRLRIFGAHLPFPALGHVRILGKSRYEYVIEPWSAV